MARPVHGLLRPLLLAAVCLLLLQASECSRPPPSSSPADPLQLLLPLDAEARTASPPTSTEMVAGDGRTTGADETAAPSSASATTSSLARAMAGGVVVVVASTSRPRQTSDDRALVRAGRTPPEVLVRSKLARRFLAGAGVDEAAGSTTDGTTPSCHSFNPHTNCPPASKP